MIFESEVAFGKKLAHVVLRTTRNTYDGSGELVECTLADRLSVSPDHQSNSTGDHSSKNKLQR